MLSVCDILIGVKWPANVSLYMKVKRLYLKYVYVTVWLHSLLIIYKQHKDKSTLLECTLAIKGP